MLPCSIAIASVCVIAATAPALAADPCALTYERAAAIGRGAHAANPAIVFTDYDGDQAAKLLAAINAQPPVTDYPAERVLVIERPDDGVVMVALVHDGCAGHRAQTTTSAWGKSAATHRMDQGFHSKEERQRAVKQGTVSRLSRRERSATPLPFRDLLLSIARSRVSP